MNSQFAQFLSLIGTAPIASSLLPAANPAPILAPRMNLSALPPWPDRRSYIAQRKAARKARRARRGA